MKKQIRFGDLVRNSGRPQVVTLWTEPEKNPALRTAIKQNRVLTVIQTPGERDYGLIGFHLQPGVAYLVFPRPLPDAPSAKVIGINYQLVEQPVLTPPTVPREEKPKPAPTKPKPVRREPVPRKFKVKVRRTASSVSEVTVEAEDQATAKRKAVEAVKGKPFPLLEAEEQVEVLNAKRIAGMK
jgi:hypothetical protein